MARDTISITRPLLEVLLELAADADPRSVNVLLVASPAGDLDPMPAPDSAPTVSLSSLDPGTPVYSDFYFPDVGRAVRNVFGVDLGTPAGQTHGRFLSHPAGDPEMSIRDDLHAVVLIAIPPWEPENVWAYDRRSRRNDLQLVAAGTEADGFEE